MIHYQRKYQVKKYLTVDDLTEALIERTWTVSSGFELEGLLFFNDAFSEDGAQEYAVYRDGQQIESITFSWCDYDKAKEIILELVEGTLDTGDMFTGRIQPQFTIVGTL
jgi:hypothetical protein